MTAQDTVRPAAVAGYFYPQDKLELQQWLDRTLQQVATDQPPVKAMIVPHAGYEYSGSVAAKAYARMRNAGQIQRVVIIGPGHRIGFDGIAAPSSSAFSTPLGDVPVDREMINSLVTFGCVSEFDGAHCLEHSLEVQLPFLQSVLPSPFSIVPLLAGWVSKSQVTQVLEQVWGGDDTLIVVSSDLSHFLDYEEAVRVDEETARAIEQGNDELLDADRACGFLPVCAVLRAARKHSLTAHRLQLINSGDSAGTRERVVGYGSWVFE